MTQSWDDADYSQAQLDFYFGDENELEERGIHKERELTQRWENPANMPEKFLQIPFRFIERRQVDSDSKVHEKDEKAEIKASLEDLSEQLGGCIKFIDDSENKVFKKVILIHRYDEKDERADRCSSRVGFELKDTDHDDFWKDKDRRNFDKETETFWQWMTFGARCIKRATIIHEFMHALGLKHEHQRPDRDEFIDFKKETAE